MATFLKIVCGSTTTDLNDVTNYEVSGYVQQHEPEYVERVSETVAVLVKGSSKSNLDTNRAALLSALHSITLRQEDNANPRVYLQFYPDGLSSTTWRSELLDYRVTDEQDIYAVGYPNLCIEMTLTLTRENGWENNSESYLNLSNGNGTNVSSGLTVYPCNDGTGGAGAVKNNWVAIAAASVAGNLPARCRIEITNTKTGRNLYQLWIGQNWVNSANITTVFEAETDTGNVWGTPTADASASGGNFLRVTPPASAENFLVSWSLSAAQVAAWKGSWAHPIIRFNYTTYVQSIIQAARFRFSLDPGNSAVPLTDYGMVSDIAGPNLLDLGGVRIPPYLPSETGHGALTMHVWSYPTIAGNIDVDCLFLLPADGYRYLVAPAYVAKDSRIIDDGVNGYSYSDNGAGSAKVGITPKAGKFITLQPGRDQRLYFLASSLVNMSETDLSMSVRVAYRARRLMV